ncbi:hypothetical protein JW879_03205 [candidate division WOR-3 bacterium]|nr:hypothetical protein [candidate division WOR-3 bacterium]
MKYKILVLLLLFSFCVIYGNERESIELKNPGNAVGASLAGTLLPSMPLLLCMGTQESDGSIVAGSFILSLAGFVIGPSAGHFYAGNSSRAQKSMGLRTVFALVGGAGILTGFANLCHEDFGAAKGGAAIATISGICILGSAAYDISTCPQSVEKYNKSISDHGRLYFSPEINLKDESFGLSLSYRF